MFSNTLDTEIRREVVYKETRNENADLRLPCRFAYYFSNLNNLVKNLALLHVCRKTLHQTRKRREEPVPSFTESRN